MNNFSSLFKKYWFVLLVFLTAVVYIVSILIKSPKTTPVPTPVSSKTSTFGTLTPGISTIDQVNEGLGKPVNTIATDSQTVSEYASTSKHRFHQVTFTNGVATLIKEIVSTTDDVKSDYITKDYGDAPYLLYNNEPNNYFNLYVYPQNGIAYLGHADGTVLEIWYFQPTTIDTFINTWGTGFSQTKTKDTSAY
jgi:hypothetical protein